jgi:hypothetical protein
VIPWDDPDAASPVRPIRWWTYLIVAAWIVSPLWLPALDALLRTR